MAIAINVSNRPQSQLPDTQVFVEQETSTTPSPQNGYFQRIVETDDGVINPKNLRARTVINYGTTGAEWAVSGELVSHSDTSTAGHAATSGVAEKHGLAQVFGAHFQAKDFNEYVSPNDVTSVVGAEINVQGIGPDHPAAHGLRRAVEIIARAITGAASAEIGIGVNVRSDTITNGTFRTGIAIQEGSAPIQNGQIIATSGPFGLTISGANTTAQFYSVGSPLYGAIFNGTYGKAAIRVAGGQSIAMESTATVRMDYTGGLWRFLNNTAERVAFDMSANPGLRVGGQKVVGKRAAALPPPATDLASAITLLNALRDRLSASGAAEHPLFT